MKQQICIALALAALALLAPRLGAAQSRGLNVVPNVSAGSHTISSCGNLTVMGTAPAGSSGCSGTPSAGGGGGGDPPVTPTQQSAGDGDGDEGDGGGDADDDGGGTDEGGTDEGGTDEGGDEGGVGDGDGADGDGADGDGGDGDGDGQPPSPPGPDGYPSGCWREQRLGGVQTRVETWDADAERRLILCPPEASPVICYSQVVRDGVALAPYRNSVCDYEEPGGDDDDGGSDNDGDDLDGCGIVVGSPGAPERVHTQWEEADCHD